ncbi:protein of unknown function [Streptomyces sp. KY75]|nr:protein of unknown function [Streptomyces sp. KY75]CAD5991254.1 protein of unknown function [Streptomyces sp. KY70]
MGTDLARPAPPHPGAGRDARHRAVGRYHKADGHAVIELDLREAGRATGCAHGHHRPRARSCPSARRGPCPGSRCRPREADRPGDGLPRHGVPHRQRRLHLHRVGTEVLRPPLGDLTERMLTGTALDPTHHLGYLTERQFG